MSGWLRTPAPTELLRTDRRIATGLAVAFFVIAAAATFVPTATGSFHDDAIYLSTAKSLAEGTGYQLINLPGAPPQTKYPILYPLVLALIWKAWPAFPTNLWLIQGLTLLSAAVTMAMTYLLLVRFGYASRWLAFGAVALATTTPFLLFISTRVLSEMPFALLLVAALWRVERDLTRPAGSRASQFLTGVIAALPYLCRSVGVVLVPAVLLVLLMRRRPIAATLLGIATTAAPWIYWSLTAYGEWQQNNIVGYYTDYLGSWSIVATDPGLVLGWNLIFLLMATLGSSLIGLNMWAFSYLAWKLAPVFILLGAVPWLVIVRDAIRFRILPLFLAAYGLLLIAWPWPPARFLLPILPFILVFAGQAATQVIRKLLPTLHPFVLRPLLGLALVANLVVVARMGILVRTTGFPFPVFPDRAVTWASYEDTFSWLRTNSDPSDRVASALDSMVYLYTNRQSFRPFQHLPERLFYQVPGPKSGTAAEVLETLTMNRAKYLAVFPIPGFEAELSFGEVVAELRRTSPDRFVPRYIGRDPRFMVFEVR